MSSGFIKLPVTGGGGGGSGITELTGQVTAGPGSGAQVATVANSAVISKVLTGYVSGAGTISATDSILSAIQKLNGNISGASGITQLTGEGTAGPGSGSQALTLSNAAVIGKVLTGYTSGAGTVSATDTILQAIQKLNGNAAAISAAAVTSMTGEATGTGPGATAVTLTNSAVIGKVLTGYSSGAGTVSATDTILQAIQKLNGNHAASITSLTGEATASGGGAAAVTLTNSAVIGKVLTGYVSGAGTVSATDTILQGIQKLDGNTSAVSAAAVTSLTGEVTGTGPGATATTVSNAAVIGKVLTGYVSGAGTITSSDTILSAIQKLNGNSGGGSGITQLTGEATAGPGSGSQAVTLTNSAVIGKVLTGYTAGAGTVSATDTILQAIQKVDGNAGNYVLKAGDTMTGNLAINGASNTLLGYSLNVGGNPRWKMRTSNADGTNSGSDWQLNRINDAGTLTSVMDITRNNGAISIAGTFLANSTITSGAGITAGFAASQTHVFRGGINYTTRTITGNLTVDTTTIDYVIFCNATTAITITLPAVSGKNGRLLRIKDITGKASVNPITIDGNASELIDGQLTTVISAPYGAVDLVCDGTGWYVL